MMQPDFYRQYFFPLLSHIGKRTSARGIPFIYHSDGVLWSVIEDIIDSGVTALHPIEPKSMDMVEVKQRAGDRLCLCGGIDLDLLSRGSESEVIDLVNYWLTKMTQRGGWCAGSSNSIPEYVNPANYLTMVRTIVDYRN
jgi:uroporphyrinogen decarboxylase